MANYIKKSIAEILTQINSGKIPEEAEIKYFPPSDIPCSNWSFINKFILYISGTKDARSIECWKDVNRTVEKMAKPIYIFSPVFVKRNKKNGSKTKILRMIRLIPVFSLRSTVVDIQNL